MKINKQICELYVKDNVTHRRKLEIAQDYVKIYRNKKLSARTSKSKEAYYRKQKRWENKVIKIKRIMAHENRVITACKRYDFL